ncbi:LOW QUALITY PROTEIN: gap junction protein alpha 10 a [Alosa alosa]|uniref:LOW QUALITY PROTEIN: gap junction protein alpha 10 a n=1 Tax=Alosa alosa TaxID=278164 RepID=UPI0020154D78|nr:LOW QUALITY PROTEIN: gap junction protein alpha 10 a [Alosa alosa]
MGDWNLLGSILEEVHVHSTIVGKIWLTILFIFRMLVLGVAAEDVWVDEQSQFVCNTEQPGCKNVCYDRAFPISLIRFWVLQIVFVLASPAYMGHWPPHRARYRKEGRHRRKVQLRAELEEMEPLLDEHRKLEKELKRLEEQKRVKKAPLQGSLLRTYVIHILTRSMVEVGFIVAQYILYGIGLNPLYKCETLPCPNMVDCYVSRPTEKTIFMVFMIVIACVSLFLNLMEISHLGVRKIKQTLSGLQSAGGHSGGGGGGDSPGHLPYKPGLQQLCVVTNMSPQKKYPTLGQTSYTHECHGEPPPLYLAAMDAIPGEMQRDNSIDEGGGGGGGAGGGGCGGGSGYPVSCFAQQPRQLRLASQGRIQGLRFQMPLEQPPLGLQHGISESQSQLLHSHHQQDQQQLSQHQLQQGGASEAVGESHGRLVGLSHHQQQQQQQTHECPHPGGPLQANYLSMPALPTQLTQHLTQHRPSRVLDMLEARRDSSDRDVLYPPHPRKASFMARLPSDSGTSDVSSCPSSQSLESELGSLNNVPMNPPGGRRMSMASKAMRLKASDLLV